MNLQVLSTILFVIVAVVLCPANSLRAKQFRALPVDAVIAEDSPAYYLLEPNGPGTYAFGYELDDPASGNVQFRDEEKLANGTVKGTYGYLRPDGLVSLTRYVADEMGYRSETETFKRPESSSGNNNNQTRHPLEKQPSSSSSTTSAATTTEELAETTTEKQRREGSNVAAVIDGQPVAIMADSRGKQYGLQLINNFVPTANFPFITFALPAKQVEPDATTESQQQDFVDFNNDKFLDPIINEGVKEMMAKRKTVSKNQGKGSWKQMKRMSAETKEARWYRDLIKRQRGEYLAKYGK